MKTSYCGWPAKSCVGIIYKGRFLYEPLQVNRLPHIKSCVQLFYSYDLGLLYTVYIYIHTHTVFYGHLVEIQILQTIWEAPSNILKLFIWAKIYTCLFQSKQKGYVPLFVVWNWATDSNTLVSLGSMVKRVNSMSVSQRNIAINSFLYLYIYIYIGVSPKR